MASPTTTKSLCYREASTAKAEHKIDEDEYYHHILQHLAGVTHEHMGESCTGNDSSLRAHDPFAYAVQTVAAETEPLKGEPAPLSRPPYSL